LFFGWHIDEILGIAEHANLAEIVEKTADHATFLADGRVQQLSELQQRLRYIAGA
jgi:hypothetical protein